TGLPGDDPAEHGPGGEAARPDRDRDGADAALPGKRVHRDEPAVGGGSRVGAGREVVPLGGLPVGGGGVCAGGHHSFAAAGLGDRPAPERAGAGAGGVPGGGQVPNAVSLGGGVRPGGTAAGGARPVPGGKRKNRVADFS